MVKMKMRYMKAAPHKDVVYEVLAQRSLRSRTYRVLRFSLSKMSSGMRKKILDKILDEKRTIGTIEWWTQGSIVRKPKAHFDIIVASET